MATIQRNVKTFGTRAFASEVSAAPSNYAPVLSNEVDADLDTVYAAWNGGTDTVNLKDGSVTFAKLAPDAQLWRDTGTTITPGTNFTTRRLTVPGPTTGADQQSLTLGSHTQKARLGGLPGLAGAWLTVNEAWNGSAWVRDDTAQPASVLSMQPGGTYPIIFTEFSAAGAPTELLKLDNAGNLFLPGAANLSAVLGSTTVKSRVQHLSSGFVVQMSYNLDNVTRDDAAAPGGRLYVQSGGGNEYLVYQRVSAAGAATNAFVLAGSTGDLTITGQVLPASYQGGQVRTTGVRYSQGGGTLTGGWSNQIGFGWTGTQITAAVDNIYNGTVNITPPSDERLKIDIEEDVPGLDAICALRPVTFRYKPGLYPLPADGVEIEGPRQYGLIAQEAQPHVPLVIEDDGSDEHFLGLDYRKLVPVLIRAVQELTTRVVALEGATA